jgi:DNA-directed RNA polymerase specialized sigma24 family protein
MGTAEEAGQQPSRLPPAQADAPCGVAAGHDAFPEACGRVPGTEADACEIGDEDLAVPGDPRERARVENAARRLADRDLVDQLAATGFTGPVFEVTVNEFAAYGVATLMAWMRTGEITRKCLSRGRPLPGAERVTATWSRDDRLEIAVETTARALRYFVDEVLKPARWNYRRGATLRTYFVGACLLQFPNVYEVWVNEQKRWGAVDLVEPGTEETAGQGRGDVAWADPTAGDVIHRQHVREMLEGIRDPQSRKAAQMVMLGYEHAEAGAELGLTAAAVGARLYRLRGRPT